MARPERLTALKVERAKTPGWYPDGGGLYLQVTEGTKGVVNKSWLYRFTLDGKTHAMGLGPLALYGLAEARAMALDARRLRHQGIDPIEHRRAARAQKMLDDAKAMTFRQCAETYINSHRPRWRNARHAAQWPSTLDDYAYSIIGALPVQAIDTALVCKVLQQHIRRGEFAGPFWQVRSETAARLRARIENVLDWAKARGYRTGENPARWRGHLDKLLPARSKLRRHHAALPYAELPSFLVELREREGFAARALEFLILTAARAGEVLGMRWSEVNLAEAIWTVPATRMKAGREHRVPLSPRALTILEDIPTSGDAFVFSGGKEGKPLSNTAIWEVLQVMDRGITAHGFRATFKTWAGEQTSFQNEIVEQALAHTVGTAVERAYRRGDMFDKRRRLMDAWATFCTAETTAHGKVVSLKGR
jgi:integrase